MRATLQFLLFGWVAANGLIRHRRGVTYESGITGATWADAKTACENSGMTLAIPTGGAQNSAIYTNWNGNNFGYWIGVTDGANEGTWLDVNGEEVTYTNFQAGQPDGGASQNCIAVGGGELWSDVSCSATRQYICQQTTGSGSTEQCELFNGQCTVQTGFSITIDTSCKVSGYSQLPANNNGLFAYPLQADDDIPTIISELSESCKFDATGSINFGFDQCGTVYTSTSETNTTLTTYVNHQVVIGDGTVSLISPIAVQCTLDGVQLDSSTNEIATNNGTINFNITSEELINVLSLGLEAGTVADGTFTPFIGNVPQVDIGTQIRVRLTNTEVQFFSFVLFDCTARSGNDTLILYEDHCPGSNADILNLFWVDYGQFDLSVFKISDADMLTFTCNLRIYREPNPVPATCGGVSGRHSGRQDDLSEDGDTVSVAIRLSGSTGSSAGKPKISVGVLTLFIIYFSL